MVQQSPRRLELTVTADQAGEKIDTLLRRELRLSGTVIRRVKWLDDGILLDGMRVTTACRPAAGQVLSVRVADPDGQGDMVPTPGPLDIVYEDGDLLVLNKAPGVLIHPGPGHYSDTLCNYIAWYYKKAGIAADVHPVQRLDKGTSGLLVVAKHPHAQEQLKGQLHTPAFRRIYLAVCEGIPGRRRGASTPPSAASPAPSWPARWTLRASPPPPATGCSAPGRAAPWWSWSWTPAAPTRSGYTWPTSATPSPATSSTARRITASSPAPPSTPPGSPSATPSPVNPWPGSSLCRRTWPGWYERAAFPHAGKPPVYYTPVRSKAGMYSDRAASAPWVKPSSPRASI